MDDNPPSPLRVPVTVVLGLTVLPLALPAWIALSGSRRSDYLRSNWVRAGIATAVVSPLPLLAVAGATALGLWPDPNPNPIGPGLLLLVGGGLAQALLAVGILLVSRQPRDV